MNVHLPEVFFKDTKNLKSCNEEIYKCRTLPEYGSPHNDCLPAFCNCRNEMIKYVYTMGCIACATFQCYTFTDLSYFWNSFSERTMRMPGF